MDQVPHGWSTPVARFCVWDGARAADAKPDVDFVAPMLRRRLSPLARAALHVANACAGDLPRVRFVYASRHGELGRTVELLQAIADEEPLSPTTFSLSVLNSAAGIFSIARNDHSPAIAVAAGEESFAYGLLEAHAQALAAPGEPVLYVYADAPAPSPFGPLENDAKDVIAVALLIDSAADHHLHSTQCAGAVIEETGATSQAAAFLSCLSGKVARWSSSHRSWRWTFA
ncbi:MAG: beta-ketoacyl synthase chain length factor [Betaproteobacteria bacterium]